MNPPVPAAPPAILRGWDLGLFLKNLPDGSILELATGKSKPISPNHWSDEACRRIQSSIARAQQ